MVTTFNLTRLDEAPAYDPPGHVGVAAQRLQGLEAGGPAAFWVGRSTYPSGARAELSPTAGDTVYVVTDGELVVTIVRASAGGSDTVADEVVIRTGDSMFLPRATVRSVENRGADTAVLLVILHPEVTRDE